MNYIQSLIDRQLGISCRFSYDNVLKRLVVDGEESYYGLQNASVAATFDHDPPIFACRFSEASGYEHILALANEDGRVALQDTSNVNSASAVESFQCHNNAVFDLAWKPGHMSFVTVSGDHTACLWDAAAGAGAPRAAQVFAQHSRSVKTAAFRPRDPAVFATGARDGHVLVWDSRARAPAARLRPDNGLRACHAGGDKTPGRRARRDQPRAISITGLVFQDDLTLISCGECDGNIKVWDLRKNYDVYKREPLPKRSIPYCGSSTKNGYTNLIVDDARVRLYASCMDDVVYCFNISTYNSLPERRYVGHENSTFYIKTDLSPDGAYLVSGSSDKNAYVWNVKYSEPVVKLVGHWAEVTCAAWCRKGDMKIVTCSDDARHKIWRIGREVPPSDSDLKGRAEVVPRTDVASLPQWGSLDKTPRSTKRKIVSTPNSSSAKRLKADSTSMRKTKRCLTDLMNASRDMEDNETVRKRSKLDVPTILEENVNSAGVKRPRDAADDASPTKRRLWESDMSLSVASDWNYIAPKPGTSFMTPTKNYERKSGRVLSPRSPKVISPTQRSPVKVSPTKVRIISFTTPTKDLPNFVLTGEAPHLRLMSPVRSRPEAADWLTRLARARRPPPPPPPPPPSPAGPGDAAPARRASVSEKTPKSSKKSRTLLNYFSVAAKN